jgi:hypothetical protein
LGREATIFEKISFNEKACQKICGQGLQGHRHLSSGFPKFLYYLLKMTQGQSVPNVDRELINAKSLKFVKPKLFFKNIER